MEINNQTITQFLQESKNLSEKSLYNYEKELKLFFNYINMPFDQVKSKDIIKWMASLYEAKYRTTTIATKYMILRSFFYYCSEEDFINSNPIARIKNPTIKDKLPYYLSTEQLDKLRDLVKNNIRERAMVETLYSTGVRVSELIGIKISDINWDTKKIRIMGKEKKERIVFFSYECGAMLQDYLSTRKDVSSNLFICKTGVKKISRGQVWKIFRGFREQLGFYLSPHTMRHTFAAHLAEKGMPFRCIQTLLGHDTINSTKTYARLCKQASKIAYDRLH